MSTELSVEEKLVPVIVRVSPETPLPGDTAVICSKKSFYTGKQVYVQKRRSLYRKEGL